MGEGIQRRTSVRNTILQRLGKTSADVKADQQLAAYIKFMTAQARKNRKASAADDHPGDFAQTGFDPAGNYFDPDNQGHSE
jgi:hypothetical protein